MKKFMAMLLMSVTFMALVAACGETGKVYLVPEDYDENSPQLKIHSSSKSLFYNHGQYTALAENFGAICSGYLYEYAEDAITNPLQIVANGYTITVTLSTYKDNNTKTVELVSGDTELISCEDEEDTEGYLYVIVI